MEEVNNLIYRSVGVRPAGIGLENYFPAVDTLYKNKKAGNLTMLGFVAISDDTSSNNRGQPFLKRGLDLRKDKFHIGGRGNVQNIKPYAIEVSWLQKPDALTLGLHGTVRTLYKLPLIGVAEFGGCASFEDYAFLSEQLAEHMG